MNHHGRALQTILRCAFLTVLSVILMLPHVLSGAQNEAGAKPNSPIGDWRGKSVCQVKPSACNDEDSFYHVRAAGTKPGAFELRAEKIIDGKPITLGTSPCDYDAAKSQLVCVISPRTSFSFDVKGDEMHGVMKMQDGTVWRKLDMKRVH